MYYAMNYLNKIKNKKEMSYTGILDVNFEDIKEGDMVSIYFKGGEINKQMLVVWMSFNELKTGGQIYDKNGMLICTPGFYLKCTLSGQLCVFTTSDIKYYQIIK